MKSNPQRDAEIGSLEKRLASLESRFNSQSKRVAAQELYISTLRKRLRFIEHAAKLKVSPA